MAGAGEAWPQSVAQWKGRWKSSQEIWLDYWLAKRSPSQIFHVLFFNWAPEADDISGCLHTVLHDPSLCSYSLGLQGQSVHPPAASLKFTLSIKLSSRLVSLPGQQCNLLFPWPFRRI